ncbi:MAG: hypothetical protein WAU01_03990 [Saprospiraceae bacterium]
MSIYRIALCAGLLGWLACSPHKDPLSAEEKFAVDTIYNNQLSDWRRHLDSICVAQKDSLFVHAVDSIKKERMEEIEMLLMKNHRAE